MHIIRSLNFCLMTRFLWKISYIIRHKQTLNGDNNSHLYVYKIFPPCYFQYIIWQEKIHQYRKLYRVRYEKLWCATCIHSVNLGLNIIIVDICWCLRMVCNCLTALFVKRLKIFPWSWHCINSTKRLSTYIYHNII